MLLHHHGCVLGKVILAGIDTNGKRIDLKCFCWVQSSASFRKRPAARQGFLLSRLALAWLIPPMSFIQQYLEETQRVVAGLNVPALEKMVDELARVRER